MDQASAIPQLIQTGLALQRAGRLGEARKIYEKILRSAPRNPAALQLLGRIHLQAGEIEKGLQLVRRAAAYHPGDAFALVSLGDALAAIERFDQALEPLDKAIALDPTLVEAHYTRAQCLRRLDRRAEALEAAQTALALQPNSPQILVSCGLCHVALGRPADALAAYDAALAIDPNLALVHSNRANILHDLGRFAEAMTAYDRALALTPNDPNIWSNRGTTVLEFRRFDEAVANFNRALTLQPDLGDAHMNLSLCRLLLGNYASGFARAEWRRRTAEYQGQQRGITQPLWLGEDDIAGKTILLYDDQGFGDALQCCRYAARVAGLGARVIVAVQPALMRLLATLDGPHQVVSVHDPFPPFDVQCPLSSLPVAFADTLQTLPAPPSYLAATEADKRAWAERLGPADRPRIGIAWSGNRWVSHNQTRHMTLERLLEAIPPGVETFAVQPGADEADSARMDAARVRRTDRQITDFADTAGLVANLDLVATVDTSMAHLTGALGRPGRVLLLHTPDWRWMLGREDSPWYPSLRLLRQAAPADWSQPLRALRAELETMAVQKPLA